MSVALAPLPAGQQRLRLAADVGDVHDVWVGIPMGGYQALCRLSACEYAQLPNAAPGVPVYYTMIGDELLVYPVPDRGYTLSVVFEPLTGVRPRFGRAWMDAYRRELAAWGDRTEESVDA